MATAPGGVEVGRVSVRVVPDTSRLFEDLKADLDRIEAESSINIRASVDSAELVASARSAVDEAQALAGNIDIKANVDTSQMGELSRAAKSGESALAGLTSQFSAAGVGAAGLILALGPAVVVLGAVAAALAAPIAVAAGGLTLFGFLAGFAVKNTLTQMKNISQLQTKLAGLTKGTATYNATLAQLQAAQAALTPAQSAFADALDRLKGAFNNLPQGTLLKPLTDGMDLLARVIPKLTPVINVASRVIDGLVKQLGQAVKSPGFTKFVNAFAKDLGPDLKAFAKIAGNVFVGLTGLFSVLGDTLGKKALKGLVNLTAQFADFGKNAKDNKGLKSFVAWVEQNMPKVERIISDGIALITQAMVMLAPAATTALGALAGLLDSLRKIKPLAGPIAAALAGIFLPFIGGPEVGIVLGLAAAFKQLYDHCKPLRQIIKDVGDYFNKVWLPKIKDAAQQVMPALTSAFHSIGQTIRQNKGLFETFGKAIAAVGSATAIASIDSLVGVIKTIGPAFRIGTEAVKLWANSTLSWWQILLKALKVFVDTVLSQFGTIINGAAKAFGWLPGIGPKVKAAQSAFNKFTAGINNKIDSASQTLANLQKQINEVGKPRRPLTFDVETHVADSRLKALRLELDALKDKTVKVNLETVPVPGVGGGMGRLPAVAPSGNSSNSNSATPNALVNVENMNVSDVNDMLRQTQKQWVAKAGGGVHLRPGPSFAGAR